MTNATLRGKPDAGNPHVRFDEGEVASAKLRRGSLLYKKLFILASFACCAALSGFGKTVAAGTSETITTNCYFNENLNVDGNLTVQDATITFAKGKALNVGRQNNSTYANLNLKNARIVMDTSDWDYPIIVGKDGGLGRIVLDNSSIKAARMETAFNTIYARADIVLTNNSTIALKGGPLTLNSKYGGGRGTGTTLQTKVTLNEGCVLEAVSIVGDDARRAGFYFNGGKLKTRRVTANGSIRLFFTGIGGHAVDIEYLVIPGDVPAYRFVYSSDDAQVLVGGDDFSMPSPVACGLTMRGTLDAPLVAASRSEQLLVNYSGETRIEAGVLGLTTTDQLPSGGDVHVGSVATLRLGGFGQTFGSFTGGGFVTNDSETAVQITLSVPEGVTKTYAANLPKGVVSLVKTGAGTLVVQKSTFDAVTVQEGEVAFADPIETGYPEYQFVVDRPYGDTYSGLAYNELDFYDGEQNVTTPVSKTSSADPYVMQNNLFDHDPKTSWWLSCSYNDDPIGSRGYVIAFYGAPFKMTSFTWTTYDNTDPTYEYCRDPGAWRLRGRYCGGEWVTLHSMTNKGYALAARQTETEKFPVTYPQTSVSLGGATFTGGSLTLPANVSAKVPAGQTFTATGSSVVLSSLAVDCAAENGTVVGGTVAATGKLYLTNVPAHGLRKGTRIPLTFSNTAVASGFDKWDLYVDGVLQEKHWAVFADGQFTVEGFGMVLIFR